MKTANVKWYALLACFVVFYGLVWMSGSTNAAAPSRVRVEMVIPDGGALQKGDTQEIHYDTHIYTSLITVVDQGGDFLNDYFVSLYSDVGANPMEGIHFKIVDGKDFQLPLTLPYPIKDVYVQCLESSQNQCQYTMSLVGK